MRTVVLIPTLHRPVGLTQVLKSLQDTAPGVEIVVACDPDDQVAHIIADGFGAIHVTCKEARQGPAYAWNVALRAMPDGDAYVLGSDDCIFRSGWLEQAMAKLEEIGGSGLVGLKSKESGTRSLSAFYLMTRDFIVKHHGGVAAVPHYNSWFIDAEACGRAQKAGCYTKTQDVVITHEWRGPFGDETYRLASSRRAVNQELYLKRREAGFPDDFPPILKG